MPSPKLGDPKDAKIDDLRYISIIGAPNVKNETIDRWGFFVLKWFIKKAIVSIPTIQGISAESQNCVDWNNHEVSAKRKKKAKMFI